MNNNINNNQENNENGLNQNNTFNIQNNNNNQQIIQFGNSINPDNSNSQNVINNTEIQNDVATQRHQYYQPNNNVINNQTNLNNSLQSESINSIQNSSNIGMENTTMNMPNSENNVFINNEKKDDNNLIEKNLNNGTIGAKIDSKIEVKEDELEKIANNLNLDFLVLGIFSIIAFVYLISQGSFKITYIVELAILIVGYIGSKDKKPYAAVCGIITGIIMILSLDIISILLGIFIIIRSFKYNKVLKKRGEKTKVLLYSIIGIIGVVVIAVLVTYFDLFGGHTLKCTRSNGENIEVKFDQDGISSLKINGKDAESLDLFTYKLQFVNDFVVKSYSVNNNSEKIKMYRNVVKDYEQQENGAVCK